MTEAHIKDLFHTYRSIPDLEYKGIFFSPVCMQICRPIPSFAATTREQIARYQKEADAVTLPFDDTSTVGDGGMQEKVDDGREAISKPEMLYSIRPIQIASSSFGTLESCAAISKTPKALAKQAEDEGWVGMRVDLWDDSDEALLVKVQYWWRREDVRDGEGVEGDRQGKGWRQCLHDIIYLGAKDGSEGRNGEGAEEFEVRERGW